MFTLVSGTDTLELDDPVAGYAIQSVTLGSPEVRNVSNNRPGADGTVDTTVNVGARAVTVNLEVVPDPTSRQTLVDALARFLHPRRRVDIRFDTEEGGPVRRITVRPDQFTAPFENPTHLTMSIGFKTVGTPFVRNIYESMVSFASVASNASGRTYLRGYPYNYPASSSASNVATNYGDQPAHWVAKIYGPASGPKLRNDTVGLELSFPGLNIPSGSYAEVSSEDRTVTIDGTANRYSTLDFLNSDWWLLEPGDNALSLPTATSGVPAQGEVIFYDTYLL